MNRLCPHQYFCAVKWHQDVALCVCMYVVHVVHVQKQEYGEISSGKGTFEMGLTSPPSYLDNVFKYTVLFLTLPLTEILGCLRQLSPS